MKKRTRVIAFSIVGLIVVLFLVLSLTAMFHLTRA